MSSGRWPPGWPPSSTAAATSSGTQRCAGRRIAFDPPVGIWRNLPRAKVNLEANPEGSEWILDIAVAARKTVQHAPGPPLIGYVDWRPDNVRLTPQGELAAVYD